MHMAFSTWVFGNFQIRPLESYSSRYTCLGSLKNSKKEDFKKQTKPSYTQNLKYQVICFFYH